jgi:hypothetical protein
MSSAFNKFNVFPQAMGRKIHNLNSDVIKGMLTNTAPSAANTVKTDIVEIAAGNGYLAGGAVLPATAYAQVGATSVAKLVCNDTAITAAGGPVGPFRYLVLYNDTSATKDLIGWYDYGSSITLNDGEPLNIDADQVNGILTFG